MTLPPAPAGIDDMLQSPETEIQLGLEALFRAEDGGQVEVRDLTPLSGHAGVGYSFIAAGNGGTEKLVVRTITPGSPATGPSDVVRQARIMQSLDGSGIPVPAIRSYGHRAPVFDRPFFVAEFVQGTGLPGRREDQTPAHAALARKGVEVMARLHGVACDDLADVWGARQDIGQEFARLGKLVDRPTIDHTMSGPIDRLRDRLLATAPDRFAIGCVHGDLHFGNMIFGPDDVRALVDWEIAFLGPTLLDLGMLAFYADPEAALPDHRYRAERWVIQSDEIIDTYRAARGGGVADSDITWHRAFAGYRFGAITLFNEMLHRRGKKHDPMWADVIRSVPVMMERSLALLDRP